MKTILERRSCRSFTDEPVAKEMIEKVAEAGKYAPSGMGKQSPIILAVSNKELRDKMSVWNAKAMGKEDMDPFYGAPVVLSVLANKAVPTYIYDGSVAIENMLLEAQDIGLGACWIHRAKQMFDSEEGKQLLAELGIEGEYEGIGNVILGHPKSAPAPAKEKKKDYIYYIE